MKKIALLLMMALGLCLGCETNRERFDRQLSYRPIIHLNLKFEKGQVIDLKIGGRGQIIRVAPKNDKPYQVRIRTENGWRDGWMEEFELEILPPYPS
jgi:hypothetical protein